MAEERGRQTSKNKNPTRLQRGFSRMARGFALPKVKRAAGGKSRKDRVKDIKKRKKQKDVARIPAPEVTARLTKILGGEFILWLGEDVNSVFTLHTDVVNNILKELCDKYVSDEAEVKKEILMLLNETKPEEKDTATLEAKTRLTADLGAARFNILFSEALQKQAAVPDADKKLMELTLALAKAVNPTVIVYSGVDRNLEENFRHDNIGVCSMTPIDLVAFRDTVDLEKRSLSEALLAKEEKVILKLDGDITKPYSLLFTDKQKSAVLGVVEGEEKLSDEAVVSTAVLTELAGRMPIVFLGRTLDDKDAVCTFLKNLRKGKEAADLGDNHVALVENAGAKKITRPTVEEIGVDLLTYTPHDAQTHIPEFLANMATAVGVAFKTETGTVSRIASGATGLTTFLQGLSTKETEARYVNFFVNSLEALPFALEKSSESKIVTGEGDELEANKARFDAITARVNGLTSKIIPPAPQQETPAEDEEKAKEENAEVPEPEEKEEAKKETKAAAQTETPSETVPTVVKVLISKKALDTFNSNVTEELFSKVETCFGAVADSNGRLDIRIVDLQQDIGEDFELLYTSVQSGLGDISLYHTVVEDDLTVHLFEHNSNLAEEKALLFDRAWTCARTKEDSATDFEQTLAAAQTELGSPTAVKSKNKRRQFFGKGKRALETDPTKEAKDGFIKRTVKSIARSSKRIRRQGSKGPATVDSAAVKGESNWVKGKKKADEEAKKESENKPEEVKEEKKEVEAATPVKATEEPAVAKKEEKPAPKLLAKGEEEEKKTDKKKGKDTKTDKKAKKKKETKKKPKAAKKDKKEKTDKKKAEKPKAAEKPKEEVKETLKAEAKEEPKVEVPETKKEEKAVEAATPAKATEEKAEVKEAETKPAIEKKTSKKAKETKAEKKAKKKKETAKKKELKKKAKAAKKDKKAKKEEAAPADAKEEAPKEAEKAADKPEEKKE